MAGEANTRPARVAAQLRQELAQLVVRDLGDPRLAGLVVSSVTMSGDLRLAKVFWRLAILEAPGPLLNARIKETQTGLERASGRLKKAITVRLQLRVAPELKFEFDAGQEKRDRIDQLLEEVKVEAKSRA